MRHTVRALIVRNKKLLLVTGYDADFYWSPGGGIEKNESHLDALTRELDEELGVNIVNSQHYLSYEINDQKIENYLVNVSGKITPKSEIIKIIWYTRNDFLENKTKVSIGLSTKVIPSLISNNLI